MRTSGHSSPQRPNFKLGGSRTVLVCTKVYPRRRERTLLEKRAEARPPEVPFRTKTWSALYLWVRSIFLFLFGTSVLFAQHHTLEVSQYLHTSWTSQEGFFKGGIHAIAQTPDGYLWLLSEAGGLLQFDGVRFSEWKPSNSYDLPSKPIFRLLASRDSSLWIGGIGLAELKANGEFRRYHQLDGTWIVGGLIEDKDGGIWASGAGQPQSPKLCRFYHGQSECYPADSFLGDQVMGLHEDRKGRLLALTTTGVWKVRPGPPERLASMPPNLTLANVIEEDASGKLVVSAGNDMKLITADGKVSRYPTPIPQAYEVLKDRESDLWFATTKGVIHLHEGRTDHFTALDGLSSNQVRCIFQDREKNLWVGTDSGLDKFTKPAVPTITSKQGFPEDLVNSVVTTPQGVPWVGTSSGLYRLDHDLATKINLKFPDDHMGSLFESSTGRMLVESGDSRGLVWLDGDKVSRLRVAIGEDVFGIAQDNRGDLWVASREFGLLHLNSEGKMIETFDHKVLGKFGIALAYDPGRDGLWLTSRTGDLAFFKGGKLLEQYGTADGLGEGNLRDPQVDKDGGVWVSTGVGLAHLRNGKISVLNHKNGLPCDAVHWMRHDGNHNVWLYTDCGLVAFAESELSSWIAQPFHSIAIAHYLDNTDGVALSSIAGWYTPRVAMMTDGRILFVAAGQLSILDPSSLNQNSLAPPVHIEGITADGREIGGAGHVSLPVKVRSIHIAFTALSFAAPRKVRFRYKLQPYDQDWSSPVSLREATYTNLPPGNYEFRVIACNNDGVWNTSGDTFSFFIPPAFYQTLSFKVLMAITAGALLSFFYLLRLKQATAGVQKRLLAQMEERERIARELHDTLLQGFQGITLRVQGVAKNMPAQDPLRKMMDEVLDRADGVLREARQRVRNLRRRTTDENDLADRLTKHGEELSKDHTAAFTLAIVGGPKVLESTVQDEAYRIVGEALTNAFRHASASKIETEVTYDSSALRIRVRDDGVGIDKAVVANGHPDHWGLTGMRERARAIRAELNIWSREAAGTEVELVIPASIAYPREEIKAS